MRDGARFGGGPGGFTGDRDQRRFGDGRPETERECEEQKPEERASARERLGHGLADREERHLQPAHEERQPDHHQQEPDNGRLEIGKRALQDGDLEKAHDKYERQKVARRAEQQPGDRNGFGQRRRKPRRGGAGLPGSIGAGVALVGHGRVTSWRRKEAGNHRSECGLPGEIH